MDLSKFIQKFVDEAYDIINNLEASMLDLEKNPTDNAIINEAFRAMHTLKGVSGMYDFKMITKITHELEHIYDLIREQQLKVNKDIINLTLSTCDHIRNLLIDHKQSDKNNILTHKKLMNRISAIMSENDNEDKKPLTSTYFEQISKCATYNILFYPDESLIFRSVNLVKIFGELFEMGQYEVYKPGFIQENEWWSIFLATDKPYDDIEEALMFILDECKIIKISDGNILRKKIDATKYKTQESLEDIIIPAENKSEASDTKKPKLKPELKNNTDENELGEDDKTTDILQSSKIQDKADALVSTQSIKKHLSKRISVDSDKLDTLMFLVSELVTANSQLNLSTKDEIFDTIRPYLEKIGSLSKQFRDNALEIRLVSLNELFARYNRMVRDISVKLGKDVEFITEGTDNELDKNTIDAIADPMMHLIRNCVDHGIETPEIRKKKGKPALAKVKVSSFHSGNYAYLKIEDDGAGINAARVKEKAIDKGLIAPDVNLTQQEIFDLIFLPGFSTAKQVSDVSGRGVGLDVVKKQISEIGGDIEIESEKDRGTTFTIKLSQSIAIIETMLVRTGNSYFMVPINDVEICVHVHQEQLNYHKNRPSIELDSRLIPYISLRETFNLNGTHQEKQKAVVLNNENKSLAIIIDDIIGEHQAVLKSMGKKLTKNRLLTAGSLLADGNIAYQIDVKELFKQTLNNDK